jgi:hypothetical protein
MKEVVIKSITDSNDDGRNTIGQKRKENEDMEGERYTTFQAVSAERLCFVCWPSRQSWVRDRYMLRSKSLGVSEENICQGWAMHWHTSESNAHNGRRRRRMMGSR